MLPKCDMLLANTSTQLICLRCTLQGRYKCIAINRLLNIIVCPTAQGLDSKIMFTMAGDQYHRSLWTQFANPRQEF